MGALKRIGNFRIIRHLGKGGMGDVYCAVQEPLGRKVALKLLMNTGNTPETAQARFETEARAISRLEHNNIVSLYDYGVEQGLSYFSMQYIEGDNLAALIPRKGLSVRTVLDYSRQICRGLLYAHRKGIIHRDVKPQNILIDKNNTCNITDFGIARLFRGKRVTQAGMAVGTPEYMSPEQAAGDSLDYRTDIYSLGILMYEMLTGDVPFSGEQAVSIAYKHVHATPRPPSAHRPGIPKRLELIVIKALKKDPAERYASVEEVLNDLDTVTADAGDSLYTEDEEAKKERERRITDRRLGDRRSGQRGSSTALAIPFEPHRPSFWLLTIRQQWLSLLLLFILAVLLFIRT
ncbi:MAG: serine/threonine protein kinase [Fibrobacterota bacterium]